MKYSEGFKASIVKKMQDGGGRTVYQIAKETGINTTTIKNWIAQFKNGTMGQAGADSITPGQRSPGEMLAMLLEAQTIPEDAKGEWLRKNGLHTEHLPQWEQELISIMNDKQTDLKAENARLKKENKVLQKETKRQEKALSELAILISLKKKYPNLFEESEGD
jgi:transposase